jgi:hypothetical protein
MPPITTHNIFADMGATPRDSVRGIANMNLFEESHTHLNANNTASCSS